MLEMVPNTAGVAHATGGDDDVEASEFRDRLALVDGFREPEVRRTKQAADIDILIQARSVPSKHFGRAYREGGVEKNWCGGDFSAFHQGNQIDYQFLRAFDCERWNKQGALGRRGIIDLSGEALTALLWGDRCANPIAVS